MTPFNKVYCLFDELYDDNVKYIPEPDKLKYYEKLLNYSIGYFEADCYKDLNNKTDYWEYEYEYLCDGKNNQFELNPPPPEDISFYVGIMLNDGDNYTEVTEYSYDEIKNIITLPASPKCRATVRIVTYRNGYFEDDLRNVELNILAYGMLTAFNIKSMEKNQLLSYQVFGNSTKAFSKAEHIKALNEMKRDVMNELIGRINEYSYKYDPLRLQNLTGRDYMYGRYGVTDGRWDR